MKRRKVLIAGLLLLCLLLAAQTVLAMSSTNFALNWFTTQGGGGGKSSSANYSVNTTMGQVGIGNSISSSYTTCIGYWCGAEQGATVFLPLIMR